MSNGPVIVAVDREGSRVLLRGSQEWVAVKPRWAYRLEVGQYLPEEARA